MRLLYNLLIRIAAPIAFGVHLWRGVRDPAYRDRLGERFGFGAPLESPSIWVHAVSVGEVQAAAPLVRALLAQHPGLPLVLTTVTPTGAARAQALFGSTVVHRYVPYDLPGAVRRFFDRVRPQLAVILETELWPNLYAECGERGVPLVLASARVSPRSVRRYRRLVPLFKATLAHGIVIGAQSEADAERFRSIGANPDRTHVTGNIKFDFELRGEVRGQGQLWRHANAAGRPVWVAGSTHEGEEEVIIEAHQRLRERCPDALLVLVPRHPKRFDSVRALLERRGVEHVLRSAGTRIGPATAVMLGDTMGELMMFYAAADVAFVAGSLVPIGGHNLLEPASLGVPILVGPHNFNAEDIHQMMRTAGAVRGVQDARSLADALQELFADPVLRQHMGDCGRAVLDANRGALASLLALVEPLLERPR